MSSAEILLLISEWLGVGALTWISGLSKRFQRRPIKFLYQRRENIFTFSMFALALLIGWLIKAQWNLAFTIEAGNLPPELVLRLALAVVLLVPFLIALLYRRQPARTLGWSGTFKPSLQLGFGLLALVVFLHGKFFSLINHASTATGVLILILLAIALLEESVFRGYIFIRLTAGFGEIPGLVMTALLSTLWQTIFFINFSAPLGAILAGITVTLVQSLILGWIMLKAGHVIAPALYKTVAELVQFLP